MLFSRCLPHVDVNTHDHLLSYVRLNALWLYYDLICGPETEHNRRKRVFMSIPERFCCCSQIRNSHLLPRSRVFFSRQDGTDPRPRQRATRPRSAGVFSQRARVGSGESQPAARGGSAVWPVHTGAGSGVPRAQVCAGRIIPVFPRPGECVQLTS